MAKAYVPTSLDTSGVQKEQVKEVPPYPDQGVRYEGYAKKYVGGGQYKLLKQYPYEISSYNGYTAAATKLANTIGMQSDKNLYITGVCLSIYSDTDIVMVFGQYNSEDWMGIIAVGAGQSNSVFIDYSSCPEQIKETEVSYFTEPTAAFTGKVSFTVVGFYEDK